ncbi:MAG: 3-hydroxyacyl-CoA dehydrogenase NAD-binding domain-containing protein [Actinomycetota bacterium]|nr:3-hydroxyacyl-CoA dehydrogenase NAD-binding domain-containing protein [Actinomycetota bacterium]
MSTDTDTHDEVVTRARVRVVDMPAQAGRLALITLDNDRDHTRPSTFGPGGLTSLNEALDSVTQMRDLAAIAVTGKPFIFAVGADLSAMGRVNDPAIIKQFAHFGHNVMRRLGEMSVPTFAFVNGAAMGGGTELALHCDYRTMSTGAAGMSLPEVFLGLVPGWGGAFLLPNLIGPADALQVIIANPMQQNKQLRPKDALKLRVVDALFEPAEFLEESIRWAAGVVSGTIAVARPEPDRESWDAIVDIAHGMVDSRLHGATPAPYRALDLVRAARTATRDEGFAAEDDALTDLVMGEDLRASLYAFDLVQRRAKKPAGVPDKSLARRVSKVGIVGAGLMASQLALLFAKRLEVPVVMTDLDAERVASGLAYVREDLAGQVAKGRLTQDKANRLAALVTGDTDKDDFADADFVIEAVFENLDVKRKVFAELEAIVPETCVLATNTSSLSITDMAAGLLHPERVVGFHFFNPVALMPLLEIARAERTDDATLATAFAVGRQLKKSCVLVKDAPAFVVNRLLTRFLGEVTRAVDEGTPFEVADRALEPLGLPMSPFSLLELVGPAVAFHVSETMVAAYPERFYASENMRKVVDAGLKSILVTGADGTTSVDPKVAALYVLGDAPLTADQVRERALLALADEVRRMLDEGVVAAAQDIDLCMILGAGWPFWLGGITPYLDRSGASERSTGQRFLTHGVASVPVR